MSSSDTYSPRLHIAGRSFLAFVLIPQAPLHEWLRSLDQEMARSKGFFAGKNFIIDLRVLVPDDDTLSTLLDALYQRHIRVIGVEGGEKAPHSLRHHGLVKDFLSQQGTMPAPQQPVSLSQSRPPPQQTHVLDQSVRSGQHIVWPDGDLVILGNVASGAEVTAGGSIHIYGALNGRAVAGIGNHGYARIYTQKLSAELIAIDGFYATAEEMDKTCFDHPCCVYLVDDRLRFKKIL